MIIYIDYDHRYARYSYKSRMIVKEFTRKQLFAMLQYLFTHTSVTASYSPRYGFKFELKNARFIRNNQ